MRCTLAFLALCSSSLAVPTARSTACNNSPSLCNRAYNNVTHLGAHDSPFITSPDPQSSLANLAGNQYYNTTEQLSAGVRLLTAQVHQAGTGSGSQRWHLCHTSCDLLDAGPLSTWLAEIKSFMDTNPNEVVSLILVNSDNASAEDLDEAFEATSGIKDLAFVPPNSDSPPTSGAWPTLQTLIDQNKRLMVFIATLPSASTAAPYLMDEFTFIFENPYEYTSFKEFSCVPERPTEVSGNIEEGLSSGRMPLMNHFLDTSEGFGIEVPDVSQLETTNAPLKSANGTAEGALGRTAETCAAAYGKAPTFLLVDFFNVGPAIQAVDELNGVSDVTGRRELSSTTATANAANSHRISNSGKEVAMVVAVAAICALLS